MLSGAISAPTLSPAGSRAATARGAPIIASARIDLKRLLRGRALLPVHDSTWTELYPATSLNFLDDRRLLVTFVVHAPEARVSTPAGTGGAFLLQGVVVDASTGKVEAMPAWPTYSSRARIIAVNEAGAVIQAHEILTQLSPALVPVQTLKLPPPPPERLGFDWIPKPSWTGRFALFLAHTDDREIWVDCVHLKLLESWRWELTGYIAVSDNMLVMSRDKYQYSAPGLVVRGIEGRWHRAPLPGADSDPGPVHFVGPGTVAYSNQVARIDGAAAPLPGGLTWGSAVSRSGRRFVLAGVAEKGGFAPLDISSHAIVLDLLLFDNNQLHAATELPVRGSRVHDPLGALSPDGRHFALLSVDGATLEIYALPPIK